jgi:hypothetical protein
VRSVPKQLKVFNVVLVIRGVVGPAGSRVVRQTQAAKSCSSPGLRHSIQEEYVRNGLTQDSVQYVH